MIGKGYTYTGVSHEGLMNIIYFDNISLVVTTRANSTQSGIDLRIDGKKLDDRDVWGHSNKTITDIWDSNPIILTLNSSSPHLTFDMNTTIYGYRKGTSMINQQGRKGISYQILSNGTIYWEFYHNLYVPSEYSDMEFSIEKPKEWDFIFVKDSTLKNIPFELGKSGDSILKVNKSYAIFSGWWSFKAKSPNYLNISNTKILKDGQWESTASFNTAESTGIKTQLNYTNKIPNDVGDLNLTIYYPNGSIFYEESKEPVGGNVVFSQITFGSSNTSGGVYKYTLFWSNGTALGGLNSSFIVIHDTLLTLLKPDDAKIDLRTEGFVGDIIPIRVLLKNSENNFTISNAVLLYNWTDGTRYFTESAMGIYETVIDTADLLTRGLHEILIKSSKTGFFDSNITLEINLGEETNLQVLDSDYNIELHANGSIRFKFSDFDGDGIDGAMVNISISNKSLYSISNPGNGTYLIEFSTLYIDNVGIYQLSINFSAVNYEPQYYIYQFQIIDQSVNITLYLNSQNINENSLSGYTFNEIINLSARAISNIDKEYLLGGNMTLISGDYQQNLIENGSLWYNTSILCTPEVFSFGINYAYLEFQHSNYRTATFGFQLLMGQLEIKVVPIDFNDSIQAGVGETLNIQITLMDSETNDYITDATVRLSWEYGIGRFNETPLGTYQTTLTLPKDLRGNHQFNLIITSNNTVYKTTQYSFWVSIETIVKEDEFPVLLVWIIIGVLAIIISALGVLSLRSYVVLPRRRKKESDLLAKTQRFKDLRNIQAIVITHSLSGIPLYSKSYSILEMHKKELFSGFIQAITTIGEEFSEEELRAPETEGLTKGYGVERIIELDFKYFYCLIADKEDIRVVFILKEKSSERLKSQVSNLLLALNLKLSQELENWDGSLDVFEEMIPIILNDYFELFYKEQFKLSSAINLLEMKKEKKLSKIEVRVINVIQSITKRNKNIINLYNIVELVSEENKDLIIEAIESLIKRQIVIPFNQ